MITSIYCKAWFNKFNITIKRTVFKTVLFNIFRLNMILGYRKKMNLVGFVVKSAKSGEKTGKKSKKGNKNEKKL